MLYNIKLCQHIRKKAVDGEIAACFTFHLYPFTKPGCRMLRTHDSQLPVHPFNARLFNNRNTPLGALKSSRSLKHCFYIPALPRAVSIRHHP